ncbi:MAG: hypothetical protein WCD18_16645 [Thermosynechococcaceae cyanobacterium]
MNIKAALARLSSALGEASLGQQLLLLHGLEQSQNPASDTDSLNIVVGYTGSENSRLALDLTLLIAYQTRLVTRQPVVVQAVYVLEDIATLPMPVWSDAIAHRPTRNESDYAGTATATVTRPTRLSSGQSAAHCIDFKTAQIAGFEAADQVLWQARSFATEWRGALNTHLRFGEPGVELCTVAEQENACLMVVGCTSMDHPLVQQLAHGVCCPVVGIPAFKSGSMDYDRQ